MPSNCYVIKYHIIIIILNFYASLVHNALSTCEPVKLRRPRHSQITIFNTQQNTKLILKLNKSQANYY